MEITVVKETSHTGKKLKDNTIVLFICSTGAYPNPEKKVGHDILQKYREMIVNLKPQKPGLLKAREGKPFTLHIVKPFNTGIIQKYCINEAFTQNLNLCTHLRVD